MHESEEKATHELPLSLPKSKDEAFDDMEEVEQGEVVAIGEPVEEDSDDNEDIGDIPIVLWREFSRLSARQDELAHR